MFLFKLFGKLITFLIISVLAIPTFALARTWIDANNEKIEVSDAIIVMGAAQLDGTPGEILEARLKETLRIYNEDFAEQIFTVGEGAPGDRFTEAGASREWLGRKGIPWRSITAIKIGRDTFTSIEALAKNISIEKYQTGEASLDKAGIRYLVREASAYLAYITLGRRGIHISDHIAWKL
jgi:hypothetical protein